MKSDDDLKKPPQEWSEAFDRQDDEGKRGPEKPAHVLNARQMEYCAHIRRMKKQENHNVVR